MTCILHPRGREGGTDVIAIEPSLRIRFWSRNLAVDGLEYRGASGQEVRFAAEMDPPGGWVPLALDAHTGARVEDRLESLCAGSEVPS